MRRRVAITVGLGVVSLPIVIGAAITGTKHDLSAQGPGPYKAASESRVCKFCHVPHSAAPASPLWNRADTGRTYLVYTSSTAAASASQPNGSSRQCLSCHDGTVALGAVLRGGQVQMVPGRERLQGRGHLSSDLSDDHPVGINYAEAQAAKPTLRATIEPPVKLDPLGRLQCDSCHDVHDNTNGKFLVVDPKGGALCLACHQPTGWSSSSHASSTATGNQAESVADKACSGCHTPHGAARKERLLINANEEDNCLACHNGWVAATDIRAEIQKTSGHDAEATTGLHDLAEDHANMPRHVECSDCHEPHQAAGGPGSGSPTSLPPALLGARGVSDQGSPVDPASTEREVCFRCHGDYAPLNPNRVLRQKDERSVRRKLDTQNASYHPVRGVRGAGIVSLLAPWNSSSQLTCTSCHNNDAGPAAGGNGPKGPHGSRWAFLLEERYDTSDFTQESPSVYALCYRCHDRNSILGDQSFKEHKKHIVGERTPCSVCHDPHGVPDALAGEGRALINFDTYIVQPYKGVMKFTSTQPGKGSCTLTCHGQDHKPETY